MCTTLYDFLKEHSGCQGSTEWFANVVWSGCCCGGFEVLRCCAVAGVLGFCVGCNRVSHARASCLELCSWLGFSLAIVGLFDAGRIPHIVHNALKCFRMSQFVGAASRLLMMIRCIWGGGGLVELGL